MKPTVHDIAFRAGVSLATVDRVLNRRPGVSPATRARVDAAVAELGYVRNLAAANLAKGRSYRFHIIVPANDNPFLQALRAEVVDLAGRVGPDRVVVDLIDVPPFDAAALVSAMHRALLAGVEGVALVAIDAPEVVAAAAMLRQAGIPVVTLVSDLSGGERDHFAGIDNRAAGRTAASLLGRFVGQRSGRVAIVAGSMLVRDHADRLAGFQAGLAEDFPGLSLLPVIEGRDDPEAVAAELTRVLATVPDIVGLYSLGAGNQGLVAVLEGVEAARRPVVIAHELTQTTRTALLAGLVDAVLHQDCGHEVRSALRVLKAKVDGAAVVEAQERIRIDIFLKDNLP